MFGIIYFLVCEGQTLIKIHSIYSKILFSICLDFYLFIFYLPLGFFNSGFFTSFFSFEFVNQTSLLILLLVHLVTDTTSKCMSFMYVPPT